MTVIMQTEKRFYKHLRKQAQVIISIIGSNWDEFFFSKNLQHPQDECIRIVASNQIIGFNGRIRTKKDEEDDEENVLKKESLNGWQTESSPLNKLHLIIILVKRWRIWRTWDVCHSKRIPFKLQQIEMKWESQMGRVRGGAAAEEWTNKQKMSSIFRWKTSREENSLANWATTTTYKNGEADKFDQWRNGSADNAREKYDKCNFLQSTVHRLQDINFNLRQSVTKLSLWCIFAHKSVCAGVSLALSLSLAPIASTPARPPHTFALSQALAHITPLSASLASTDECNKTTCYLHLECLFSHSCYFIPSFLHFFPIPFFLSFMFRHSFYFNFCFVFLFAAIRTNDSACLYTRAGMRERERER